MLQGKRNKPAWIVAVMVLAVVLRTILVEFGWVGSGGFVGVENPGGYSAGGGYPGGNGDWIQPTPGGTVGGNRDCFYYNDPSSGSSVMTPGC
jgi:hypothetical protein